MAINKDELRFVESVLLLGVAIFGSYHIIEAISPGTAAYWVKDANQYYHMWQSGCHVVVTEEIRPTEYECPKGYSK